VTGHGVNLRLGKAGCSRNNQEVAGRQILEVLGGGGLTHLPTQGLQETAPARKGPEVIGVIGKEGPVSGRAKENYRERSGMEGGGHRRVGFGNGSGGNRQGGGELANVQILPKEHGRRNNGATEDPEE